MTLPDLTGRVFDARQQIELLKQHGRDLAQIKGDLARVLAAVTRTPHEAGPAALDALVHAAWDAIGARVWTTGELLARTLDADHPGLALDAAIRATGRDGARSLGQYLARLVPQHAPHLTPAGLELRRVGTTSDALALWSIGRP